MTECEAFSPPPSSPLRRKGVGQSTEKGRSVPLSFSLPLSDTLSRPRMEGVLALVQKPLAKQARPPPATWLGEQPGSQQMGQNQERGSRQLEGVVSLGWGSVSRS